jgi:HEAT repeat protein
VSVFIELREAEERGRAPGKGRIKALLAQRDADEAAVQALREGVLAAFADAPRHEAFADLVLEIWDEPTRDESPDLLAQAAHTQLLARAAAAQGDPRHANLLVRHLTTRVGREEIRGALASLGEPALGTVLEALHAPETPRNLRVHLPRTLAHFGTKQAADALLRTIETDRDGLVRYKAIRGLGKIVAEHGLRVDRSRVEDLAVANLREHLRLLGLAVGLERNPRSTLVGDRRRTETTRQFLSGLLGDKARQSLERAFRLVKIAHPDEDIHSVHRAALSADKPARANAGEFLDTLLTRRHERALRDLLRLVTDDLEPDDRVARAARYVAAPATYEEAVVALARDGDTFLSSIACEHARATGERDLYRAAKEAAKERDGHTPGATELPALFDVRTHAV